MEQLYAELKPLVKLETIEVFFDEETSNQYKTVQAEIKKIAIGNLKKHPFKVYKSLSNDPILPQLKNIIDDDPQINKGSFLKGISTIYFDNNKNISKPNDSKIYNPDLFTKYFFNIKFSLFPFLEDTFKYGIKSNHLTYQNLLVYLNKTWIGLPYIKTDLDGTEIEHNLITIIAPSIVEYFTQMQAWTNSKYYVPSFILCIDSLSIKIEGLLRNFCERLHIPTAKMKRKGMQECHINELLNHEIIKQHFSEDDLLLLNYIFGNEGGMNLRNNVAHCFYGLKEYHPNIMLLLILTLLRISKYNPTDNIFNKKQ